MGALLHRKRVPQRGAIGNHQMLILQNQRIRNDPPACSTQGSHCRMPDSIINTFLIVCEHQLQYDTADVQYMRTMTQYNEIHHVHMLYKM